MKGTKLAETDDVTFLIWLVTIDDYIGYAFGSENDAMKFIKRTKCHFSKRINRVYISKSTKDNENDVISSITFGERLFSFNRRL